MRLESLRTLATALMGRDGALSYKTKDELVQALSALPQAVLSMRPARRFAFRQGDSDAAATSDFFRDALAPRLPESFGDDRVLVFPKDADTVYVAWDVKPSRFGHGEWTLVVRDPATGRVLAAEPVHRAYGSRFVTVPGAGRARVAGLRKGPVSVDGPLELQSTPVEIPSGVNDAVAPGPAASLDWPTST